MLIFLLKINWLFENIEAGQSDCLTFFAYLKEMHTLLYV